MGLSRGGPPTTSAHETHWDIEHNVDWDYEFSLLERMINTTPLPGCNGLISWCAWQESNLRPSD